MEKLIWVKQMRGTQQTDPQQKKTLRALGLKGIGTENWIKDSRSVRGMLNCVHHLISADLVDASAKSKTTTKVSRRGYKLN